jgi:hypothetical protein
VRLPRDAPRGKGRKTPEGIWILEEEKKTSTRNKRSEEERNIATIFSFFLWL